MVGFFLRVAVVMVPQKIPPFDFVSQIGIPAEFQPGVALQGHNFDRFVPVSGLVGESVQGTAIVVVIVRLDEHGLVDLGVNVRVVVSTTITIGSIVTQEIGRDLENVAPGPSFHQGTQTLEGMFVDEGRWS